MTPETREGVAMDVIPYNIADVCYTVPENTIQSNNNTWLNLTFVLCIANLVKTGPDK